MQIYLLRHGQTDWNAQGKVQGFEDVPLNQTGMKQAEEVAQVLRSHSFNHIYTSKFIRAKQTADIVNHLGHNKIEHEGLNERNFGDWEGKTWEDIARENPGMPGIWSKDAHLANPSNGESFVDFMQRCKEFLDFIINKHTMEDSVLIVAHGAVIKSILTHALKIPHWEVGHIPKIYNCCLSRLIYDGNAFKYETLHEGFKFK